MKNHGITLIALVVTIIIMLILAGVVLHMALGDNGLIKQSKFAKDMYEKSAENESKAMEELEDTIRGYEHAVESPSKAKTTIEIKDIGKNINYGIDLDGNSGTYDWKIFYQGTAEDGNANGRIFIIAADYVPVDNTTLATATDASHANMTSDTASNYNVFCKYWNSEPGSLQSMEQNDFFLTSKYTLTGDNVNAKCVSTLLHTDNWNGFVDETYGEYAIGGPTIEMWCEAWNELMPDDGTANEDGFMKITPVASQYGYDMTSSTQTEGVSSMYINGGSGSLSTSDVPQLSDNNQYNVFFPHVKSDSITSYGKAGSCNGYWLASPGTTTSKYGVCNVHYNGLIASVPEGLPSNTSSTSGIGFRPIVCLKSGIQLTWDSSKNAFLLGTFGN